LFDGVDVMDDKGPEAPFISAPMLGTVVAEVVAVLLLWLESAGLEVPGGGATCGKGVGGAWLIVRGLRIECPMPLLCEAEGACMRGDGIRGSTECVG
jgi:hypothetical protein